MSERKVIPITGKHTTMHSMLAEAMADPANTRGFIIYFDEEGTMHHGHFGATRADTCMAAAYLNTMAMRVMEQLDE